MSQKLNSLEIWFKRGHNLKIQREQDKGKKIKESLKIFCSAPYQRFCFYKVKYGGVKYCKDKIGDCRYQYLPESSGEQEKQGCKSI